MIEPARFYTSADVAAWLQHSTRWFRAHRRRLESEGFPPPRSIVGHPRWSGADLLEWLNREKPAAAPAKPERLPRSGKVVDYRAVLAERAQALAAAKRHESR